MNFDNHYEAFVSGLLLAVTAPTEEQSHDALAAGGVYRRTPNSRSGRASEVRCCQKAG